MIATGDAFTSMAAIHAVAAVVGEPERRARSRIDPPEPSLDHRNRDL